MGYQVYVDQPARDHGVERWAGYGVPAICDFPACTEPIDRGMGYRCETVTIYTYFDEQGNPCSDQDDWDDEREEETEGCQMHFCTKHLYDHDAHKNSVPKPDTREWIRHVLADSSWAEWRADNPRRTRAMRASLGILDRARVLVAQTGLPEKIDDARMNLARARRIAKKKQGR